MNNKILAGMIVGIIIVGVTAFYFTLNAESPEKLPVKIEKNTSTEEKLPSKLEEKDGVIKFISYDEIKNFLKDNQNQQYGFNYPTRREGIAIGTADHGVLMPSMPTREPMFAAPDVMMPEDANTAPHSDYVEFSGTNVQVKNVDEPDYLKTDGKYLYIVNQNWLTIIDAYPAENAKVILKIALDIEQQNLENMFLNGDK